MPPDDRQASMVHQRPPPRPDAGDQQGRGLLLRAEPHSGERPVLQTAGGDHAPLDRVGSRPGEQPRDGSGSALGSARHRQHQPESESEHQSHTWVAGCRNSWIGLGRHRRRRRPDAHGNLPRQPWRQQRRAIPLHPAALDELAGAAPHGGWTFRRGRRSARVRWHAQCRGRQRLHAGRRTLGSLGHGVAGCLPCLSAAQCHSRNNCCGMSCLASLLGKAEGRA
mmetsp:Transcript_4139/g.16028  ORF Transcript_4139/g.16028 Transcript_4139/m.16028 type:complete len:223 (-) Transcript_4139:306-974(-)